MEKLLVDKIRDHALKALQNGQIILYPTDTVWGLGCDATNQEAVASIFRLKKRAETKSLVILMSSLEMLRFYVGKIPKKAIQIINASIKPTTIIYEHPRGIAPNSIGADNTVAIRIPNHPFCSSLISKLRKPIVSTSANISGESTPMSFSRISQPILQGVDYIVNLEQDQLTLKSSTIIKINGNDLEVIRA